MCVLDQGFKQAHSRFDQFKGLTPTSGIYMMFSLVPAADVNLVIGFYSVSV